MSEDHFKELKESVDNEKLETEEELPQELEEEAPEEKESQPEEKEEAELTPTQEEAYALGWRPKDDFKGDAEKWNSAHNYLRLNKMQNTINSLKQSNEKTVVSSLKEIENLKKYHKGELEFKLSELQKQRDDYVEDSDIDGYKHAQAQIDSLNKQKQNLETAPEQPGEVPEITAWNQRNPDIVQDTTKTAVAIDSFSTIQSRHPTMEIEQQLILLDRALNKEFGEPEAKSKVNHNRSRPSVAESSRPAQPRQKEAKYKISDLDFDGRQLWEKTKDLYWRDEKTGKPDFQAYAKTFFEHG